MKPRLIIIAHGSSVNPTSARQVGQHAALVAERPRIQAAFDDVGHAYLKQSPNIDDVDFGPESVVVPYFMAQGYFVETVLPRHVPDHAHITPALGTADFLPVVKELLADHRDAHLVLVGHGTERDPRSSETVTALAERCKPYCVSVTCAFVDQAPGLDTAWARVPTDGRDVVVLPYFAFPGPHTTVDIPEGLAIPSDIGAHQVHGRTVHYLEPITTHPATVDVLTSLALNALED